MCTLFKPSTGVSILMAAWPILPTIGNAAEAFGTPTPVEHSHSHSHPGENLQALSLDVYSDQGTLHLLSAIASTRSTQLAYARIQKIDQPWPPSLPPSLQMGKDQASPEARGRGTDFQIAAYADTNLAVWLAHGSGYGGRGPLVAARSNDGGLTWNAIPSPADDGSDDDHAFIDLAATPDGSYHAVWLDARYSEPKGLRYARLPPGSDEWLPNVTIDPETCECCWTTLKVDSLGNLYALYRDKKPRDMALATSSDQGRTWTAAGPVGAFGWDFDGCPHVGGGLAIENGGDTRLHAIVWSGAKGHEGLAYLQAKASSLKWSTPLQVGSRFARHADIAADPQGNVFIAWTEHSPQGSQLRVSKSSDSGLTWNRPRNIPGHNPSHPRLAITDNGATLLWTEPDDPEIKHRNLDTRKNEDNVFKKQILGSLP